MVKCWICEQKEQWKKETYFKVRNEAIAHAKETNTTVPIYKNGALYQYTGNAEGLTVLEYVSAHTEPSPL